MMRGVVGVAIVAAAAAALHAQPRGERFRFERPVIVSTSGPQRLAIDVPLLAGGSPFTVVPAGEGKGIAQGGLSDLRFFDAQGAVTPYLLISAPARQAIWTAGDVLPVPRTDKTSGFEADFHAAETVDAIRVSGIPAPFLKRLTLEGSGDREHWTLLVAEGTLFDLPDEGLRETELAFRPGSFRYVRVVWNDTNSGRVPPPAAVEARSITGTPPPPTLTATLPVERRPSEPGRTRYRVNLPAAHLPIVALDLDAAGGHVFRDAAVFESRLSGAEAVPSQLGRATLKRVVRDGVAASALRIPVAQPGEAALDIVVEDGGNPPLDLKSVRATFAELPWIYLEPHGPIVARYGDRSAAAPAYDLEAVRDTVKIISLPEARWGDARSIAESAGPESGPAAAETGAPIDPATFAYVRPIPGQGAGLFAVSLDAAALSHSRGPGARFADVRIIDNSKHQVPYLVERRDEPLVLELAIRPTQDVPPALRDEPGRNRSLYAISLPYGNLPGARVAIETSGRVFQRPVQLGVVRPPNRRNRDSWFDPMDLAVWTHGDPQTPPPAITLNVRQTPDTDLLLAVDEGDNGALPIAAARLLLPSYRLRFYRPANAESLQLVYGRDDIAPPRYDIALLAPQVMGADARDVLAGPESGRGTVPRASFITPRTFWIALGLAVIVLLAIIARLVRI